MNQIEENSLLALIRESLTSNGQPTIISINVHATGQYIAHVDQYYQHGNFVEAEEVKETTPEDLQKAVITSMSEGLWWANTSWAVVYRVYQIKGYKGNISQFLSLVHQWKWEKAPDFPCTYDAIQKPVASGKMIGNIDKWQQEGASEQMIRLGRFLLDHLN